MMMTDTYTFKIFRFDPPSGEAPSFQEYDVPAPLGATVLDRLYYIQDHLDGSLAFRSACRAGICGSCAMHINGTYRLACETQLSMLKPKVTIRPLAHLPIIRDLVVDMASFWAKYDRILPFLVTGSPPPEKEISQSMDDRALIGNSIDCILCACCFSSCTMTATDPDYLGPAALLKMNRFILDSRDAAGEERLLIADNEHGVWRCHTIFNCQEVCPKDCDPTGAIANLKRKLTRIRFGGRLKK